MSAFGITITVLAMETLSSGDSVTITTSADGSRFARKSIPKVDRPDFTYQGAIQINKNDLFTATYDVVTKVVTLKVQS